MLSHGRGFYLIFSASQISCASESEDINTTTFFCGSIKNIFFLAATVNIGSGIQLTVFYVNFLGLVMWGNIEKKTGLK